MEVPERKERGEARRAAGGCPSEGRKGDARRAAGWRPERRRWRKREEGDLEKKEGRRRRPEIKPSADPRRATFAVRTARQRLRPTKEVGEKGRAQKVRRGERRARRAARALRDSTLERCPGREKAAVIAAVHNEEEIAPSRGCRNTLRRGESACSHQVTSEPKRCSQKVAGTEEGLIHDKDLEGPQRQPAGQSLADQRGQKGSCPGEESPDRHHSMGEERKKRAERIRTDNKYPRNLRLMRRKKTEVKKGNGRRVGRKEPSGRESRTNPTKKRMGWARR